jgi:hypothetical protein
MPSFVSFEATGEVSPKPTDDSLAASTPFEVRNSTIEAALSSESF